MINDRNINIITDADNQKIVIIKDIVFKRKRNVDWESVKKYLAGYVGDFYQYRKVQILYTLEVNCLKNLRNQRAEKR